MRPRILVVDDEPEVCGLLDYVLSGAGYDVVVAAGGFEAVRVARELSPDLVLLDIMMPDMDGFTVATLLREEPATARIPIIILSAHGGTMVQAKGAQCGVHRCLIKTGFMEETLAAVRECLDESPHSPRSGNGKAN